MFYIGIKFFFMLKVLKCAIVIICIVIQKHMLILFVIFTAFQPLYPPAFIYVIILGNLLGSLELNTYSVHNIR